MDDMLVKSKVARTHINDLREAFATLRKYQMKLNPTKCTFGITSRKFFSFMVFNRVIEANLETIKAVKEMGTP